jgi:1-acyl-sn-glycerol-3-phosphate acyltransferase
MTNPLERLPLIGRYFREPGQARVYQSLGSIRRRAKFMFFPLRAFFRAVARTQHSEIQAIGLENIPPDGAVFLVGNHPNSYLDFLNLATVVRHPVATAAKDTITRTPVVGGFLRDYALLVPVSRAQDKDESGVTEADRVAANEKMVTEAVDLLVRGRLFNIYAEGRSTDSRRLNKIKLGFMMLAIEAEKQFNFNLNLRIVPYGYFYDRINKFQSSVCIIFGKPFKIKHLVALPDDFLRLTEKEQQAFEKKLLTEGKDRLKTEIEELIISIHDPSLVHVIDSLTAIYCLSPVKYMNQFENIREKYVLSKTIAEAVQNAAKSERGAQAVEKLRELLRTYQNSLERSGLTDSIVRREYTMASLGFHLKALLLGVLFFPLVAYGYLANFVPRQCARFMRYYVIHRQKRPLVDGDENSILAAAAAAAVLYPAYFFTTVYAMLHGGVDLAHDFLAASTYLKSLAPLIASSPGWTSALAASLVVYLAARLWRFSLFHGRRLGGAFRFILDACSEPFLRKRLQLLRSQRADLIDQADFIIGDYH